VKRGDGIKHRVEVRAKYKTSSPMEKGYRESVQFCHICNSDAREEEGRTA